MTHRARNSVPTRESSWSDPNHSDLRYTRLALAVILGLGATVATQADAAIPALQGDMPQAAQESNSPPAKQPSKKKKTLQTVQVTASRIPLPSVLIPTPEVPVGRETLNLATQVNVGAALNSLPYFQGSNTPQTGSTNSDAGGEGANLRGIGASRTLVLLDGERFVGSSDLGNVPSVLIKGVQVVTGGASAAWGSGAVAGVVNLMLNTKLNGLTVSAGTGMSSARDGAQQKFEIAGGTDYAGSKGHVVFGLDYINQHGVYPAKTKRDAIGRWIPVPLDNGQIEILGNVGYPFWATGGIINSGVLNGYGFNPDGSIRNLNYGPIVSGSNTVGNSAVPGINDYQSLIAPVREYSFLAHTSYKLNDNVTLTGQVRTSRQWNNYRWFLEGMSSIPINADNAFLPTSVRDILAKNGEDGFLLGRINTDFGIPHLHYGRGTSEIAVGAKGTLPGFWHWRVHMSYGKSYDRENNGPQVIASNFNDAVDAVMDPATHQPVCAVTLTDPSSNCVPINLFGEGAPSQSAINYVTGYPAEHVSKHLGVFSAQVTGEPFTLPAGPLSVAAGVDYRYRSSNTTVPPFTATNPFIGVSYSPLKGAYHVKEAFGEVNVPIVTGLPGLHDLSADIAGRISNYSQSGSVGSWKVGFVDGFGGGFHGRIDLSRDIRAPDIDELFSGQSQLLTPIFDPVTKATDVPSVITGGNPDLKPEKALTFTAGISWLAPMIPGFAASVDFYRITIANAITTASAQNIVDLCAAGQQLYCSSIQRGSNGQIQTIFANFENLAEYKTSGVDLDVKYDRQADLFGAHGTLHFRALATWVHELTTVDGGVITKYVGTTGDGGAFASPHWKGIVSAAFDTGGLTVNARLRFISTSMFNRNEDIINNHIPSFLYYDAGASYKLPFARAVSVYFNVDNLTNRLPPHGVMNNFSDYYDWMGRYYTTGIRVKIP